MASAGPRASTIAISVLGVSVAGLLGYAVYFDYQRRNNLEFRKKLKKQGKQQAKAAKMEAEVGQQKEREQIRSLVEEVIEEGFPQSAEEKEAYFMQEVGEGEQLSADSNPRNAQQAAQCFFKALRVYPQQAELMEIYKKTVPKAVLDIVTEMEAQYKLIADTSSASSTAGVE